ncbi:uncharacterized protein GLRG_01326 [Colletotrichum graminicola M1.001]|uniref:Uncharacterized protein n=1 Tax=Colletotrichum graminicola (strain M1.001 / M2 / FGSC 10212) TaxID=645133 RepID=E3Q5T4_COLGM|nr:uncharacterized protein GLRG_01326 [Colletotrichum graminicola M1.001]EFQ26182.1 hypothetical protein GLRG_01326 [Colletotrichum graminicola M1.001]
MEAGNHPSPDSRLRRAAQISLLRSSLSAAVHCWLAIGQIIYSPAPLSNDFVFFGVLLLYLQLVMLLDALDTTARLWRPGRGKALLKAVIVGFSTALAYAILAAGGCARQGQWLWWALAGVFGGVGVWPPGPVAAGEDREDG